MLFLKSSLNETISILSKVFLIFLIETIMLLKYFIRDVIVNLLPDIFHFHQKPHKSFKDYISFS